MHSSQEHRASSADGRAYPRAATAALDQARGAFAGHTANDFKVPHAATVDDAPVARECAR